MGSKKLRHKQKLAPINLSPSQVSEAREFFRTFILDILVDDFLAQQEYEANPLSLGLEFLESPPFALADAPVLQLPQAVGRD